MKLSIVAGLVLLCAGSSVAAQEREMSQAQADAIANALADDPKPPVNKDCKKPMRDGKCPPVASNRQLMFSKPGAGGTAAKNYTAARAAVARPIDLAINFVTGSAELTQTSRRSLDRLAASFTKAGNSLTQFFVDGHTDRTGTCAVNLKLSQERAASAVEYLATAGVDRSRMTPRGFGFEKLKAPSAPNAAVNRRVEVVAKRDAGTAAIPSC